MAMQEVQHIIEILKEAHQRQQQDKDRAQRQEEQESLAANRLAVRDEADKAFQQHVKEKESELKLAQQAADLQMKAYKLHGAKTLQEMGESYQKTGVAPGAQAAPMASSVNGNFSPMDPSKATGAQLTIPGMEDLGSIQVANPQEYAQRQAGIAETLAAPARKTEELKQGLETDRQVAVTKATQAEETKRQLAVLDKTLANQTQLEAMRIKGENYRNSVSTATQLKIANLPYAIFNNMDPKTRAATTQPSIDAMSNGDMSAAQVQKEFAEKGLAGAGTAVIATFMGSGGVPPTDKQVTFKQSIKPIVDSLPLIQEYISLLPKTSGGVGGAWAGATHPDLLNPELDAKLKQIKFNIATVAKNLSGDQGQRLQKALLEPAEGGYLPSKYKSTSHNVSNFNKLVEVVNSAIDANLGSLPKEQRAHIKNELGLTKIPVLTSEGSPVQQASPVGGPSPAALKIMQELGIK